MRIVVFMLGAFPIHDWQFWAATVIFAVALAWVARRLLSLLPFAHLKRRRGRPTTLTVKGRPVDPRGSR